MRTGFTPEQEEFRAECAAWLDEQLSGPFARLRLRTAEQYSTTVAAG